MATGVIAASAGSALADGSAFQGVVGPFNAKHGYKGTVNVFGCGTKFQSASIGFLKSFRGGDESATIGANKKSKCKIAKLLSSASLSFGFGTIGNASLVFHPKGKLKHLRLGKGCKGTRTLEQPGTWTGKFKVDAGYFGMWHVHSLAGSLEHFGKQRCTFPGPTKIVTLSASFAQGSIIASQPRRGSRSVFIFMNGHSVAPGVFESYTVNLLGGSSLFNAPSSLNSAHIGAFPTITSGSLHFTATPACSGKPNGRTGTLNGAYTVHVAGIKVVFNGASAFGPALTRGNNAPCGM